MSAAKDKAKYKKETLWFTHFCICVGILFTCFPIYLAFVASTVEQSALNRATHKHTRAIRLQSFEFKKKINVSSINYTTEKNKKKGTKCGIWIYNAPGTNFPLY